MGPRNASVVLVQVVIEGAQVLKTYFETWRPIPRIRELQSMPVKTIAVPIESQFRSYPRRQWVERRTHSKRAALLSSKYPRSTLLKASQYLDSLLGEILGHVLGYFLLSTALQKLTTSARAAQPNLRKEILVSVAMEN